MLGSPALYLLCQRREHSCSLSPGVTCLSERRPRLKPPEARNTLKRPLVYVLESMDQWYEVSVETIMWQKEPPPPSEWDHLSFMISERKKVMWTTESGVHGIMDSGNANIIQSTIASKQHYKTKWNNGLFNIKHERQRCNAVMEHEPFSLEAIATFRDSFVVVVLENNRAIKVNHKEFVPWYSRSLPRVARFRLSEASKCQERSPR